MLYTTIKIPNHVTVSVTSAGVLALPANPRRFYATLVNQSNVPIWIKLGSMAAVDDGITQGVRCGPIVTVGIKRSV